MMTTYTGGDDLGGSGSGSDAGGVGGGGSADMAHAGNGGSTDMAHASSGGGDMAGSTGALTIGSTCDPNNNQCPTGMDCAAYQMGATHRCSPQCTANQTAAQCTAPALGTCNGMGYCKF